MIDKARERKRRAKWFRDRYRSDPAFRERVLARGRKYDHENRPRKTDRRVGVKRPAKPRASRARVTVRAPRPPKPQPVRVPAEVRSAWSRADENSIIRRKYPTPRDLQRGAERGEFSGRV